MKARWGKLTGDHLDVIAGKHLELAGKAQEGYGIAKNAGKQDIKRFEESTRVRQELHW